MIRADIRHLDCRARKRLIVDMALAGIPPQDIATVLEMEQHGLRSRISRMQLTGRVQRRFNAVIG